MKKFLFSFLALIIFTGGTAEAFNPRYEAAKERLLRTALQFLAPRSLYNNNASEALGAAYVMNGDQISAHRLAVLSGVVGVISNTASYQSRGSNADQHYLNFKRLWEDFDTSDMDQVPDYQDPNSRLGELVTGALNVLRHVGRGDIQNPGQERAYLIALAKIIYHSSKFDATRDQRTTQKIDMIRQLIKQEPGAAGGGAAAAPTYAGGGAAAARPQGDGFVQRRIDERKQFQVPNAILQVNSTDRWMKPQQRDGNAFKAYLRSIFAQTKQAYLYNYMIDGQVVNLDTKNAETAIRYGTQDIDQKYGYRSPELPPIQLRPYYQNGTKVSVVNAESFIAAKQLREEDASYDVIVMDLANQRLPGGGVYEGSMAQEEDLARQSNLQYFLDGYYDSAKDRGDLGTLHNFFPNEGGVYVPDVTVFRAPMSEGYRFLPQPWNVAVGAIAAYNIRQRPGKITDEENYPEIKDKSFLRASMKRKIEVFFDMAFANGHDTLVLGAIGCGAFGHDNRVIADIYDEILTERAGMFRKVVFAVLDANPQNQDGNFAVFNNQLNGMTYGASQDNGAAAAASAASTAPFAPIDDPDEDVPGFIPGGGAAGGQQVPAPHQANQGVGAAPLGGGAAGAAYLDQQDSDREWREFFDDVF